MFVNPREGVTYSCCEAQIVRRLRGSIVEARFVERSFGLFASSFTVTLVLEE